MDPLKYISDANLLFDLSTTINILQTVGIDRQSSTATEWHYGATHVWREIYRTKQNHNTNKISKEEFAMNLEY